MEYSNSTQTTLYHHMTTSKPTTNRREFRDITNFSTTTISRDVKQDKGRNSFSTRGKGNSRALLQAQLIDAKDTNNLRACAEYAQDIYETIKRNEHKHRITFDIFERQTEIDARKRAILVDWLVQLHFRFRLHTETLFLAVSLMDRYIAMQPVSRKALQLVGIVALLIAAKYEEIYPPTIDDLLCTTAFAFSRDQVLGLEKFMLKVLDFDLTMSSSYSFLSRFVKVTQAETKTIQLSNYYLQRSLQEINLMLYPPSLLAAACVYLARITLKSTVPWAITLEDCTSYSESEIRPCALEIHEAMSTETQLRSVYKKFRSRNFGRISEKALPSLR